MAKLILFILAFVAQLASAQQCNTIGTDDKAVPDRAVEILKNKEETGKYLTSDLTVSIDPAKIQRHGVLIPKDEICSTSFYNTWGGLSCSYCRDTEGHDLYKYNALPRMVVERPQAFSNIEVRVKAEFIRKDYNSGNFDEPYDHVMTVWGDAGVTDTFKIHLRCVKGADRGLHRSIKNSGASDDQQYSFWAKRQLADLAGIANINVCESAPAPQAQGLGTSIR